MKVIIFSGKAEHGKSSAASITKEMLESCGYNVIRLSYGDYVKQTAKMLFGWNGEKDEAGRALLQWWGTDKVRATHPDFWVQTVIRLVDILDGFDYVLIDDARYENEITEWKGREVLTVRVDRPGHVSALTEEQLVHISETALDGYKFDVRLSATNLHELEQQVINKLMPFACGGEIAGGDAKE